MYDLTGSSDFVLFWQIKRRCLKVEFAPEIVGSGGNFLRARSDSGSPVVVKFQQVGAVVEYVLIRSPGEEGKTGFGVRLPGVVDGQGVRVASTCSPADDSG